MAITILPPYDSDEDSDHSSAGNSPSSAFSAHSDEELEPNGASSSQQHKARPYKRPKIDSVTSPSSSRAGHRILVPGEIITTEPQWMRGHGTYSQITSTRSSSNSNSQATAITATLPGPLQQTNKLLSITPLRCRYSPSIGDLVIGRISSVDRNRWRVDIAAPLLAQLPLSSINLPGGVLRRRTTADELQMRNYFQEGDLLVAEVQSVGNTDGVAMLHTRSLRYGKLRNGVFFAVRGAISGVGVVRSKRQVFMVATANGGGDVEVTLGVNGYIWLSRRVLDGEEQEQQQQQAKMAPTSKTNHSISNLDEMVSNVIYSSQNDHITPATRREIAKLCFCITLLVDAAIRVDEDTVCKAYRAAVEAEMETEADDMDVDVDVEMQDSGPNKTNQRARLDRRRILHAVLN